MDNSIGKNIRFIRLEKGMSQEKLASMCGFSNTTLSAYENDKKKPGLDNLALMAHNLGVTIDRLYFGDESEAFIYAEENEGKRVVNAIYYLWTSGVIREADLWGIKYVGQPMKYSNGGAGYVTLICRKYQDAIARLLERLNQFRNEKAYYGEKYDEMVEIIKESVATEINEIIKRETESGERNKRIPKMGGPN